MIRAIAGFALLFLLAGPVHVWNAAGHMVHGALTYFALKQESPATIAKVLGILKAHQDYDKRWAKQIDDHEEQESRDLMLFMLAARWPTC